MKSSAMPPRRTPMPRGAGPKRKTPIKARRKRNPALEAARVAVQVRSGGWCEVRGPQCTSNGSEAHHRCPSDRRRNVHLPERMLWCCRWCHHDYVHANPALSYACGWLLRSAPDAPSGDAA